MLPNNKALETDIWITKMLVISINYKLHNIYIYIYHALPVILQIALYNILSLELCRHNLLF